jgi:hypothetical protein
MGVMKVSDVPQDLNYYKDTVVRDLNYAVDEQGRYQAVVSDGWEPKDDALDLAWDDIREQCDEVLERIKKGETSPLEYHAVKNLMPINLLSSYTGFSKRTIRKHFNPANFIKLDNDTLSIYADVLRITVEELKTIPL